MTTTGDIESTGDDAVRDAHTRAERYEPAAIEPRWQGRWADLRLYDTDLDDRSRPRFFLLTMYPYPSGALHIGHWYIKSPTDAIARYKRMHGFNVFLPIGFDGFGLPAENAAIKNGMNPRDWTMANIEKMRGQLRTMGATFAWDAEVVTCDPEYYRWNQWMFLKFLDEGPGVPQGLARGLVPQRRHARPRAGRGHGPALLALRREGGEARAAPVVPRHHRLRGRPAGLHGHRLAGAGQADADELDRALVGRRDRVRDGAVRPPCWRRGAAGLHHAPGHAVRRDVHGPGTGARAGRDADRAGSPGRGGRLRGARRPRRRRSTASRRIARRPASPSARTRSTP